LGRGGPTISMDGTDATSNTERTSTAINDNFGYINTVSMEAVGKCRSPKASSRRVRANAER